MESNLTTPAIVIFTTADCSDVWSNVLLGIEEEGIPFVIQESQSTDVIHKRMAGCLPIAAAGWHWLQSRKTGRAL
ncbi:propanediol utilization: diol dehydratase reactivation [Citrobacter freundii]|nr:propanediol utilization: diol dehydratase reactivation [Citrobacter freundii]